VTGYAFPHFNAAQKDFSERPRIQFSHPLRVTG
jgi:hypothetical protein